MANMAAALSNPDFAVVAIGASAGGLDAFTEFFHALPADTGMAFVLVQHLSPTHRSMLAEIVAKTTRMPVAEIKNRLQLKPNHVYTIPHDALAALAGSAFRLTPRGKQPQHQLAVNFFMRSLAQERGAQAIGMILSGTGADGTLGLEDIKAEGGLTFAQEPATAAYDGMPRSAIDSGCVDFVLPPKKIAAELARLKQHPYLRAVREPEPEMEREAPTVKPRGQSERDFAAVLTSLRKASGVDFSQYKPGTLRRRALRRALILKLDNMGEYARYLRDHPEEAEKLYEDILIPVTSFFRDFEAFEALKTQVYPVMLKERSNERSIRMWAPGCSTGEETYSLAITLLEYLGERAASYQISIFGTDLNDRGIEKARTGVYRESIAEEISTERLKRFFIKTEDGYRVNKAVRDMCIFARQNLASDPPFSQMNLVACRNLLIYVQPLLQRRIMPILHYALKPGGFLVLGSSESASAFPEMFVPFDKKHKIYSKKPGASRLHYDLAESYYPAQPAMVVPERMRGRLGTGRTEPTEQTDFAAEADRMVLKHHAPPGVLINSALEIVQYRGRTSPFLEPAPGKPSLSLLRQARNGLAPILRTLVTNAAKTGMVAKKEEVDFDANGRRKLTLWVWPIPERRGGEKGAREGAEGHFLILFDAVTPPRETNPVRASKPSRQHQIQMARLQQELAGTRDALRATVEHQEELKEEYQSANEEILSANEELQSTNEELETSKEELQSANEELSTLNAELRSKNSELHGLTNDIQNFLNSTRLPLVMLDRSLRIRRASPAASAMFSVRPSDLGRPLADLRLNLEISDLEAITAGVLESLQPAEREVRDRDGRWYSLSVLPYRTQENKIDGVVLTLQDIEGIKTLAEDRRRSSDLFESMINAVREPVLVLDGRLRVLAANRPYLETFKALLDQTVGKVLTDLSHGVWDQPELRCILEERRETTNFKIEREFEHVGARTILINTRQLTGIAGQEAMTILAMVDATERLRAQAAVLQSEKRAAAGRMAAVLAHEINNPLQALINLFEILRTEPAGAGQPRRYLDTAAQQLERINYVVRSSLALFREKTKPARIELGEFVDVILRGFGSELVKRQVQAERRSTPASVRISSHANLVAQVLTNVLNNALEAITAPGRIAIRIRGNRRGASIAIADSGRGIPERDRAHIFEPFFTTKGERGTGLGLWVAQSVMQELGGTIRVRSSVASGRSGTMVLLQFPRTAPETAPAAN